MRQASRALSVLLCLLLAQGAPALAASPNPASRGQAAKAAYEKARPAAGELTRIRLDGLKIGIMGQEPSEIGIGVDVAFGADAQRYLAMAEVRGALGKAFSYALGFEDGAYLINMQNLSSAYTLGEKALQGFEPPERPIDYPLVPPMEPKDLLRLIQLYGRVVLESADNGLKAPSREMEVFARLGIPDAGRQRTADVLGEQMTLGYNEAKLDAAAMDVCDEFARSFGGAEQGAMAEAEEIISKYTVPVEYLTDKQRRENDSTYVGRGDEVSGTLAVWSDASGENARSERVYSIATGEGDKRVWREVNERWEQRVSATSAEQKIHRASSAPGEITSHDERTSYSDADGELHYETTQNTVSHYESADYKSDSRTQSEIRVDMDADGRIALEAKLVTDMDRQHIEMSVSAQGTEQPASDSLESDVHVLINATELDQKGENEKPLFALDLAFRMGIERTPMPEGKLAPLVMGADDKPALELSALSQQQKQALQSELSAATYMTTGALMATPGVAKLIAEAQQAIERAVQEMLDSFEDKSSSM